MAMLVLPSQLASLAGGRQQIEIGANSLEGIFNELDRLHPMIRPQLFDATGQLRQFVGLFVDDQQRHSINNHDDIANDSRVLVLMSVAGG